MSGFKGSQTDEGLGCLLTALAIALVSWALSGFKGWLS